MALASSVTPLACMKRETKESERHHKSDTVKTSQATKIKKRIRKGLKLSRIKKQSQPLRTELSNMNLVCKQLQ